MTTISANLQTVREGITRATSDAGRPPGSVSLMAVSKTWPAERLREAAAAGQRDFGENYLQEAEAKIAELAGLGLTWHFIGPIQSNKTGPIARNFHWVHSVDRLKIAQRLSAARLEMGIVRPLEICLQVNISGEASKSGVNPADLPNLARTVANLPGLRLRGLMAIPEPTEDMTLLHQRFAAVRQLLESLNQQGLALDTLSMGMSDDFPVAIAEGATIVRVGSAIFGNRVRSEG